MTAQPPILPTQGVPDSPDSPASATSADEPGDLMIQDTPVIDATKLSDSSSDQG